MVIDIEEMREHEGSLNRYAGKKFVGGLDTFLSGWGKATDKFSYAFWICDDDELATVKKWIEGRNDISKIRVFNLEQFENFVDNKEVPKHVSAYLVYNGHPALGESHE